MGRKEESPILLSQYWKINTLKIAIAPKIFHIFGTPIIFSPTVYCAVSNILLKIANAINIRDSTIEKQSLL